MVTPKMANASCRHEHVIELELPWHLLAAFRNYNEVRIDTGMQSCSIT
jgi:hypothetical protein